MKQYALSVHDATRKLTQTCQYSGHMPCADSGPPRKDFCRQQQYLSLHADRAEGECNKRFGRSGEVWHRVTGNPKLVVPKPAYFAVISAANGRPGSRSGCPCRMAVTQRFSRWV